HGEIIGGAVHGEPADVAAREKQRTHHVRIRGERESRARRDVESGAVVPCFEARVGKGRAKDLFDQFLGEPSPAAVGELDLGADGQRHGALKVRGVGKGAGHAESLEPAVPLASHQAGRNPGGSSGLWPGAANPGCKAGEAATRPTPPRRWSRRYNRIPL